MRRYWTNFCDGKATRPNASDCDRGMDIRPIWRVDPLSGSRIATRLRCTRPGARGIAGDHSTTARYTRFSPSRWALGSSRGSQPALVAQRTRASDYGSEGWGFESLRARQVRPGQRHIGKKWFEPQRLLREHTEKITVLIRSQKLRRGKCRPNRRAGLAVSFARRDARS